MKEKYFTIWSRSFSNLFLDSDVKFAFWVRNNGKYTFSRGIIKHSNFDIWAASLLKCWIISSPFMGTQCRIYFQKEGRADNVSLGMLPIMD